MIPANPGTTRSGSWDCETREKNAATLWKMIASISSPVLVLRGIGSAVLPSDVAERMEKVLPNGRLQTITGAGHALMSDNPGEFADALYPFLSQLQVRTKE
jgi:pimeloyl-ACP methyl ester carboxylesterase